MNNKYPEPRWKNGKRTKAGKEAEAERKREIRPERKKANIPFLDAIPEICKITGRPENEIRDMYVHSIVQFDYAPRVTSKELKELKRLDKIPNDKLRNKLNSTKPSRTEYCVRDAYPYEMPRKLEKIHHELGITKAKHFIDYDEALKITKAFDWEPHETGV